MGASRPGAPLASPPGESIPLTIEPLDQELPKSRDATAHPDRPRPSNGRSPGAGVPASSGPDDDPVGPRPMPRRGAGILGRLFGPPLPPPPAPRDRTRPVDKPKDSRDPDAKPDPDPDTLARGRIERQVRATLGDRVRSFDVTVNGRNVVIFAQPSRFWLRRSVRRSLEALPVLQGYRARIEVGE
jgi:hypothetical protein